MTSMQHNKKTIISIVAILLVLVFGIIGFSSFRSTTDEKMPKSTDTPSIVSKTGESDNEVMKASDETAVTGSIFDLLKLGNTAKCTFSSDTDSVRTSGTTYLSGKQVRGDFSIISEGTLIESHMYSDGEWVYTWSSLLPQGIKMKLDAAESEKMQQDAQKIEGMEDFQNKFDYKCSDWTVDDSMFVLPNGVQFTDFSETLKNLKSGENNMCAACDMVPDDAAKAECKNRLGCN